ncbi:MAG: type II and III secretion system protein [Bacteroidota bacterium]
MSIKSVVTFLFCILLYTISYTQVIIQEYKVQHLVSEDAMQLLQSVNPEITIINHKGSNRLILKGEFEALDAALRELEILDQEKLMVNIEFMLIEYFHDNEFDWGIDITSGTTGNFGQVSYTPGGQGGDVGFNFNSLAKLAPQFHFNLRALINEDKAKVLTNPHLTVEAGQSANIELQDQRTIQLETATINGVTTTLQDITAGINMTIEPTPTYDSLINLKVTGIVSEFLPFSAAGEFVRENNKIQTIVDLKDGETLIIGGMIQETNNVLEGGFPILKDIPGLGLIFKRKSTVKRYVERVIYITPHILSAGDQLDYDIIKGATELEQRVSDGIETDREFIKYKDTRKAYKRRSKRKKDTQ